MKLSAVLLALVAFTSCAASQSSAPKTPWKISLETSGGMAGRGNGSISINSDGAIEVTTTMRKSCSFTATADELQRVRELLAAAKPSTWKASYAPENRCCDRFQYDFTVDEAGTVTKTEWIDDPQPMPQDLVALSDAIKALLAKYKGECR